MSFPKLNSWFLAARPKTLSAAFVPILVGTAIAFYEQKECLIALSIFALLSSLSIQVATNLFNDALDFKKGADTAERVGPKRVTQSGLLSSRQVHLGAVFFLVLAAIFAIPLLLQGGLIILLIGLFSFALAYAYTGGPYPLAYKGLGEIFVILFFGIIAVGGVFFLQTGRYSLNSFVGGLQIGCLASVLISINNLRDAVQDAKVNKNTLAVRFGRTFALRKILFFFFVSYSLLFYWYFKTENLLLFLPLVTIPLAYRIFSGLQKNPPGPIYNRFLGMAAGVQMCFGILISIALFFS